MQNTKLYVGTRENANIVVAGTLFIHVEYLELNLQEKFKSSTHEIL